MPKVVLPLCVADSDDIIFITWGCETIKYLLMYQISYEPMKLRI